MISCHWYTAAIYRRPRLCYQYNAAPTTRQRETKTAPSCPKTGLFSSCRDANVCCMKKQFKKILFFLLTFPLPGGIILEHQGNAPWEQQNIAGWSSSVARRAHNPKVVGSNPAPATTKSSNKSFDLLLLFFLSNMRFALFTPILPLKEKNNAPSSPSTGPGLQMGNRHACCLWIL